MALIVFDDPRRYDFAVRFLERPSGNLFGSTCRGDELSVEVEHPAVAHLLQRLGDGQGTVLPYIRQQGEDAWIIVGQSRLELDRTLLHAGRFVLPTYAEFSSGSGVPILHAFDPAGTPFQRCGAALYSVGYYSWRSPSAYRERILQRLRQWVTLESQCPSPAIPLTATYRGLYERFQSALAAWDWPSAEACLSQLQQHNLTTADNLAFLQVQALAQQQQWSAIWQRPDYETVARLRMPRTVRAALLTAFHSAILLPKEQQGHWHEAFAAFRDNRPRLGSLLTSRLGLTGDPIDRVFAYEAAFAGDRARLQVFQSEARETETQRCLAFLLEHIPAFESSPPAQTPRQRSIVALADRDYDAAITAAQQVAEREDRAILLLDIAFHSGDRVYADSALLNFWDLPIELQLALRQTNMQIAYFIRALEDLSHVSSPPPIQEWLLWFERALAKPGAQELLVAVEYLKETSDERYWTEVRIRQLAEVLLEFVLNAPVRVQPYARGVMDHFMDYFLQDPLFPRSIDAYAEVYEALYLGLFERREINTTSSLALLRLADAKLRRRPLDHEVACSNLMEWFRVPIPALEGCVLEAFDLLAEYGAPGGRLVGWYREWVSYLLELPSPRDRASLEAWLAYGEWIQPGTDLLSHLRKALASSTERDTDDPITALPAGYRIAIFTLRFASAARARQALLGRNAQIDVQICGEIDLNEQVKALARNNDMAIVVATCITHALTYGIGPYLQRDPVYPASSGSTSIVRAVEDQLRRSGTPQLAIATR